MRRAKRILDVIFASLGLVILSPILVLIAILVRILLGTPVIFRQQRPGLHEKPFFLYKFRTMTDTRNQSGNLLPDAARLTGFGRLLRLLSLDELPELFNILRGDMSFVGPRALRPGEIEAGSDGRLVKLEEVPGFEHRIRVRPGLTGLAQVYAPRDVPRRQKFRYDRLYVRKRSTWLDLRLILVSFWISFRGTWEARGRKY
jgi:sugar transferase EpsL